MQTQVGMGSDVGGACRSSVAQVKGSFLLDLVPVHTALGFQPQHGSQTALASNSPSLRY